MTKTSEKISCIDIGSNAIKYRQYRLINKKLLELDTFKRTPLRLGTNAFNEGKMLENTYEEFLSVLKKLKKHAKKKEAKLIGLFATSAMRTFSNKEQIVKKIKKDLGLKIEILSGIEEATLLKYFDYRNHSKYQSMVVDVGGGSTEIYLADDKEEKIKSFQLGGVRILKKIDKKKNWIELEKFLKDICPSKIQNIIGVGGNAKLIIQVSKKEADFLSYKEMKEIREILKNTSVEKKIKEYDFPEDRADIIEHAASIFEFIQNKFKTANFYASSWNISDGFVQKKISSAQATSWEAS